MAPRVKKKAYLLRLEARTLLLFLAEVEASPLTENLALSPTSGPAAYANRTLSERRRLGAFYTPERLSQILANWAIRTADDQVLEPSFGGCGFLAAARDALARAGAAAPSHRIYGCDLDPVAFGYLASVLGSPTDTTGFILGDFLDCDHPPQWPERFSVVLANPPYIPHHRIGQERVQELSSRTGGIPGTGGRSSLWAYFISHSVSLLETGGRMAWVLPGAFLQADYAAHIRQFLATRFNKVAAFSVRERLFLSEGTDEETVILLAEGFRTNSIDGTIELGEAQTLDELETLIMKWSTDRWKGRTRHSSPAGLCLSDSATNAYDALAARAECVVFESIASVRIGLVTGANEFFVLARSQLMEHGLQEDDCMPIFSKFRACPGLDLTTFDLDRYLNEGGRALLISKPGGPSSERVDAYLDTFNNDRRNTISTFRKRAIWSRTNDGQLPDAFLPVMHHTGPRLVLNKSGFQCTNTLHRVFFNDWISVSQRRLASISLLSTFSQISAELVGRRYGSGVLKHEPRDAGRISILMPYLTAADANRAFARIDNTLRREGPDAARKEADEVLFKALDISSLKLRDTLDCALRDMRERRRPTRRKI